MTADPICIPHGDGGHILVHHAGGPLLFQQLTAIHADLLLQPFYRRPHQRAHRAVQIIRILIEQWLQLGGQLLPPLLLPFRRQGGGLLGGGILVAVHQYVAHSVRFVLQRRPHRDQHQLRHQHVNQDGGQQHHGKNKSPVTPAPPRFFVQPLHLLSISRPAKAGRGQGSFGYVSFSAAGCFPAARCHDNNRS